MGFRGNCAQGLCLWSAPPPPVPHKAEPPGQWPHLHNEGIFLPLIAPLLPPQEDNFPEQEFRAATSFLFPLPAPPPRGPPAQLTGSICYPHTWHMAQALALWRGHWPATPGVQKPGAATHRATLPPQSMSSVVRVKLCFLHHLSPQSWAPLNPTLQD